MDTKFIIDSVGVLKTGKLYTSMYGSDNPLYAVKMWREVKRRGPRPRIDGVYADIPTGSVFMFLGVDEQHGFALMLFESKVWNLHYDCVIGAAKIFKQVNGPSSNNNSAETSDDSRQTV